jgi:hypothetical protein
MERDSLLLYQGLNQGFEGLAAPPRWPDCIALQCVHPSNGNAEPVRRNALGAWAPAPVRPAPVRPVRPVRPSPVGPARPVRPVRPVRPMGCKANEPRGMGHPTSFHDANATRPTRGHQPPTLYYTMGGCLSLAI